MIVYLKKNPVRRSKSFSPLALPAVLGNILQRRVKAIRVITDITVITEQQTARVRGLATSLTHGTLQTTPAFTQHHLGDLYRVRQGYWYVAQLLIHN